MSNSINIHHLTVELVLPTQFLLTCIFFSSSHICGVSFKVVSEHFVLWLFILVTVISWKKPSYLFHQFNGWNPLDNIVWFFIYIYDLGGYTCLCFLRFCLLPLLIRLTWPQAVSNKDVVGNENSTVMEFLVERAHWKWSYANTGGIHVTRRNKKRVKSIPFG